MLRDTAIRKLADAFAGLLMTDTPANEVLPDADRQELECLADCLALTGYTTAEDNIRKVLARHQDEDTAEFNEPFCPWGSSAG